MRKHSVDLKIVWLFTIKFHGRAVYSAVCTASPPLREDPSTYSLPSLAEFLLGFLLTLWQPLSRIHFLKVVLGLFQGFKCHFNL